MGADMSRRFCIMVFIPLFLSCTVNQNTHTLLLDYDEFGPPVVAHKIIGMDWWQWEGHGDSRPRKYAIKVVVYKNIDLKDIENKFPVNSSLKQDYRYVEYSVAIDYLNELIGEGVLKALTDKMVGTRTKIIKAFDDGK